jgi:hypothetical protein
MKKQYASLILLLGAAAWQGCIKDEPKNPEADIESFVVDQASLAGNVTIDQPNRRIQVYLTPEAYQRGIAPVLQLSKGASSVPASGDSIHFDKPVQYTITSQSGANSKTYEVLVVSLGNRYFNFDSWVQQSTDKYEYPLEPDGVQLWSSGNPGVALSGVDKDPKAYPTRSTTDSYTGPFAAEMVTREGTPLSGLVGIKLFAGSVFLGTFNSQKALAKPLEATEFGQPFSGKPKRFTGYYKYEPGASYQDKSGNIIPGVSDSCSIYAVFFKGPDRLNGTNVLSSNQIVATAILKDGSARAGFTRFDIPFEYVSGATMSGNMMLAIVASSSKDGDLYKGAIGSRLVIDSVNIIHE